MTMTSAERLEFDTLKKEVADMKRAMGDWNQPQLTREEMQKQRDDGSVLQLPNGDNPLFWSTRWGRIGIDDAVKAVGSFDARLKTLETGTGGVPAPPPSTAITGPLLPAGSLKRGTRTPYDSSVNTVFENPPKTLQPDRFFTGVTRFDGIVAINMDPVDADAPLQVGGDGTAEILMLSNRKGLDGQNASYQHCGVFKLANDNSMGFVQNAFYRRGQRVRTDPTRRVIAVHCDSLGDLSINRGTLDGKGEEKSQALVIKFSEKRQMWVIAGAWAGVGIAVRASVSTNDFGDVDSDNHPRELVLVEPLPVGP